MTARRSVLRVVASSLLAGGVLVLSVAAQDRNEPPPRELDHSNAEEVHAEIARLLVRIERGLRATDELIWDATAPAGDDTSVGDRLLAAREGARRAVEDIDELMRIAWHESDPSGPEQEPGGS